jgi:hypothetical protein
MDISINPVPHLAHGVRPTISGAFQSPPGFILYAQSPLDLGSIRDVSPTSRRAQVTMQCLPHQFAPVPVLGFGSGINLS